jgi:hypothetical protein
MTVKQQREIDDILDDIRGMLMKIKGMASRGTGTLDHAEIAAIASLAAFALRILDEQFPRGDRPPIDAFLLDDDE